VKILVLHPGALGDIIMSLPAVGVLRQLPASTITMAGNMDFLEVVARGYADHLLSFSRVPIHHLYGTDPPNQTDLVFWRSFDAIVSWTGFGDPNFTRNLEQANDGAVVAPWKPGPSQNLNVSQAFMASLSPLLGGVIPEVKPARLSVADSQSEEWLCSQGLDPRNLIAIHPGAGAVWKRWPEAYFAELLSWLRNNGWNPLLIEGPAELGLGKRIDPECAVAVSLPLALISGILRRSRTFVGNDSGISHLAAGLGTPTVVLFGPTNPVHWAPIGNRVLVLRNSANCQACSEHGTDHSHSCLQDLSVQTVSNSVCDLLQRELDSVHPDANISRHKGPL
jgi:heptosyltransferase III